MPSDSWLENTQRQNSTPNYTQRMAVQALTEPNLAGPYSNIFDGNDAAGKWSPLAPSSLVPSIVLVPPVFEQGRQMSTAHNLRTRPVALSNSSDSLLYSVKRFFQ